MKKTIVKIDEEKCNGCGLCASACHEGAIQMINGKAKLVNPNHCDGLGACLPVCPTGAIELIDVEDNDPIFLEIEEQENKLPCGCPGSRERIIEKKHHNHNFRTPEPRIEEQESQLVNWPVQLKLINTRAQFLQNAHLLIAADCVAYAYANMHNDFIKGRIAIIGCPKLDDIQLYYEKILDILKNNTIKSITVVKMEVPCCNGIAAIVKHAMLESQTIVPYSEVTISVDGKILED